MDTWSKDGNEGTIVTKYLIGKILARHTSQLKEIPNLYLEFAKRLEPNDTVITFNYDTLLENALDAIGNPLRLSRTPKRIFDILQKSEPTLDIEDAFSVLEEFYEWFHRDVFYYHLTKISELLNNIGWGIQTYLSYEYSRSYTVDPEKTEKYGMGLDFYYFQYPSAVQSKLGKYYYWDLMNEIRAGMYIPRFSTSKYLEGRY